MKRGPGRPKKSEAIIKDIKRKSRKQFNAEEKLEIINLVEGSELSVRRTLNEIGVCKSTFYNWYDRYLEGGLDALSDKKRKTSWNKIPEDYRAKVIHVALDRTADSPRELATYMTDNMGHYISESSVYRILKAADVLTGRNHEVIKNRKLLKVKSLKQRRLNHIRNSQVVSLN